MKIYEKEVVRKEILQCLKSYFHVYKEVLGRKDFAIKASVKGKDIEHAIKDSDDCSDMFLRGEVTSDNFSQYDGEWYYLHCIPVDGNDLLNGLLYKVCYCISPDCYTALEFNFEFDRNLLYLYEGYEWMYDLYVVPCENGYTVRATSRFPLDYGKFLASGHKYLLLNKSSDEWYEANLAVTKLYDFVKEAHKFQDCFVVLDSCGQLRTYSKDGVETVMLNSERFDPLFKSISVSVSYRKVLSYYCFLVSSDNEKMISLEHTNDSVIFIG